VPTLLLERFAPPTGTRDARASAYRRARAADALAGRTVWCNPPLRAGLQRRLLASLPVHAYADAPVRPEDIVVLDEAAPAAPARECGAHVIVHVRRLPGAPTAEVDAYLIGWGAPGALVCHLAAVMPHAGRVAEKDLDAPTDDLPWSSLFADVVGDDRAERVGGRRHPCPAVAMH
jgi:hypothetical protein